jgi:hypothetical protein
MRKKERKKIRKQGRQKNGVEESKEIIKWRR